MEGSGFNRIAGSPEDAQSLGRAFHEAAEIPVERLDSRLSPEKTERERTVVEQTVAAVDRVARMYGAEPRPISTDRVTLVAPGAVKTITGDQCGTGVASYSTHSATIDRQESDLVLAHVVAHESMHLRGYKSAAALPDGRFPLLRAGLKAESGLRPINYLNEAVTEELARLAVSSIGDPAIAEEREAQRHLRQLAVTALASRENRSPHDEATATVTLFPGAQLLLDGYRQSKGEERERLAALLKAIEARSAEIRKSNPQMKNLLAFTALRQKISDRTGEPEEAVFARFARAYFGRDSYASLIRYVEEALGPGSFRDWQKAAKA